MRTGLHVLVILSLLLSTGTYADSQADTALNQTLSDMISELLIGGENQGYEPSSDPQLFSEIQQALALLNQGANSNVYEPDSLSFSNFYNLTAFDASILVSGLAWNPDLVQAFLSHGASATNLDANGWDPMDYAVLSFFKNQTDSVAEINSGLKIVALLEAHGAKISDARHLDGIPPIQNDSDLAGTVLALKIMSQLGLVPVQDVVDAAIGPAAARASLSGMTAIDPQFLVSNGAQFRNLQPGSVDRGEISALQPPSFYDGETSTHLYLVEPDGWEKHNESTFQIATGTAQNIDSKVDLTEVSSWVSVLDSYTDDFRGISNALKLMLNLGGTRFQDRVVFSSSDGLDLSQDQASVVREQLDGDSFDLQTALFFQNYLETGKPIVFQAAGNTFLEEGNFMSNWGIINGPRTLLVGAVAKYPTTDNHQDQYVVFPESSIGADLCAPLPRIAGKLMLGTSCSTPVLAAMYRQFAEWYGSKLSYDEIIAAALLTADKNFLEFSDPNGAFNTILNGNSVADLKTEAAVQGLSGQCGAGVVDEMKWQKALDWMSENKSQSSPSLSLFLPLKEISDGVYAAFVPQSLTLSRLTFFLPQARNQHSDAYVQTPNQAAIKLPLTATEVLSTFAFANQDLKAGEQITVSATEPLLDSAGIVVRGEPDGNVIQSLRNQLSQ